MPEQASIRDLLELGDFDGYLQSKPERRERRRDRVVDLALQLARIVQERKRG
jgi:hypothetical protein